MIYVIDHKDSFTHNVVHQLSLFDKVKCTNYDEINNQYLKRASTIVLSPGPGSPKDYPITSKIYKNYKGISEISVASGVVMDSNANHEFNENYIKAKALIDLFK